MNLTSKQWMAIVLAVLGVTMASTTQLSELIGPQAAKTVVTVAGLLNSLLASILAVVSSQTGLVKDVEAMPGVEKITVNAQANQTLAGMAVDPMRDKIEPAPRTDAAVNDIAKGNV